MAPALKFGQYTVLSSLGKGGMGEVWRARDQNLGREVAIKTLPEAFARDRERLSRFQREARLLATLNHPNIAAVHEFEEENGVHFLVLELAKVRRCRVALPAVGFRSRSRCDWRFRFARQSKRRTETVLSTAI